MTEVQPLVEQPVEFVETVDTKSIRIPVAHPPLPDPVPASSALGLGPDTLMPKREPWWRRALRSLEW